MKILSASIFLFMFRSSPMYAQGNIHGSMTDSMTTEPLPGVTITLKGTLYHTVSGTHGVFDMSGIPTGEYMLHATYLGYIEKIVLVEITAEETLDLQIELLPDHMEGGSGGVPMQTRDQNEEINLQMNSNRIQNILSGKRLQDMPEENVSTALSRLSGVSMMNEDQINIRGVQAKQNMILMNGIQLPSTDITTRATDLDFISSHILSGIEVIKTLTPDMDANTIGGTVNVRLREAPGGFKVDVLAQGNYNHQDHTTDNYKTWLSVSDRFFDGKLGVFLQGNADRANGGNDIASAAYSGVASNGVSWSYGTMTGFSFIDQANIDEHTGGSMILDYVFPHGKFILHNMYVHSQHDDISFTNSLSWNPNTLYYYAGRNKYGKDVYLNLLQGEYRIGEVSAELSISHSYATQYTSLAYNNGAGDYVRFCNRSEDPFGLDENGRHKTFNQATLTPDDVYNISIDPNNYKNAVPDLLLTMHAESFYQHLYTSSLDVTIPVSYSPDVATKIKIGGKFTRMTRTNSVSSAMVNPNSVYLYQQVSDFIPGKTFSPVNPLRLSDVMDQNYYEKRGRFYLENKYPFIYALEREKFDAFLMRSSPGWVNEGQWSRPLVDDFDGVETSSALYMMGTFDIGPRLIVIGGGRFEHVNMTSRALYIYKLHELADDPVLDTLMTVDRCTDNFFPSVHVRYKISEWADIKIAASKSIARPDYNAIVPSVYSVQNGSYFAGNPNLKPATSVNYDVAISAYSEKLGVLAICPFYKKIENLFYQATLYYSDLGRFDVPVLDSSFYSRTRVPVPAATQLIFCYVNNPSPGYVQGIEFDWQTRFWYLPKPFNAVVLNINYTKSWSDMAYHQLIPTQVKYKDPVTNRWMTNSISTDSIYHARLAYQANDRLNVAVGIDYKDFSGRISLNLQGNMMTGVSSSSQREGDLYTGNVCRWDVLLQQKLPVQGLSVMLSGVNIFHNPISTYQNFRKYGSSLPTDNLQSTIYELSLFALTLRYTI